VRTLASLLDRKVETEGGRRLGHCHDLRAELTSSSLHVTGLVIGRRGRLEHLGIGAQPGATSDRITGATTVPWSAVLRIEGDRIVVRDDAVD
jgi:sporulation protein YlmC with PRC-barrel domain